MSAIEKVWIGGVMKEDALEGDPVDKVESGGGDHPVEVVGGWARGLFGDLTEDLKEEKDGDAR